MKKMDKMNNNVGLRIGAMCDPVYIQLREQGFNVTKENVAHYQRAHDGYVQLRVLGCITDAEANKIGTRLVKSLAKYCSKLKTPNHAH